MVRFLQKSIALVVLTSLVLQFLPAPQPAEAFSVKDVGKWLAKLGEKISFPQILLNEQGYLKIGRYELACLVKDARGNCVNPFKHTTLSIFGHTAKSQKNLIYTEGEHKGEPIIPRPYIPEQCELKIPLPTDPGAENESQKMAEKRACIYLARLQEAAAQQVFLANRIFNATDPFTECSFIRNCRSNCTLKLGELTFTITLLDVAALFVPGGFLTILQKILNIYRIVKQAWTIVNAVRGLFDEGVTFINDIFSVMNQVSSFFEAISRNGLKMSDVLIYGAGAVASYFGGKQLQEIGFNRGGNIGWLLQKGGDVLTAGQGVVGEAAATMVLNTGRAKKATDSLQETLAGFAENNLKFVTAKNEAIQFNEKLKSDLLSTKEVFKTEPYIAFLFNPKDSKKEELQKYLNDFSSFLLKIDDFLAEIGSAAVLTDGTNVQNLVQGKPSIDEFKKECTEPASSDVKTDTKPLEPSWGGNWPTNCPEELKPYKCFRTNLPDPNTPEGKEITKWISSPETIFLDFSGEIKLGDYYNEQKQEGKFFCYLPHRAYSTQCTITNKTTGLTETQNWIEVFKEAVQNVGIYKPLFRLTDPEYIKRRIVGCDDLSCFDENKCKKTNPCCLLVKQQQNNTSAKCNDFDDADKLAQDNDGEGRNYLACYGIDGRCTIDVHLNKWRVWWETLAQEIGTAENFSAVANYLQYLQGLPVSNSTRSKYLGLIYSSHPSLVEKSLQNIQLEIQEISNTLNNYSNLFEYVMAKKDEDNRFETMYQRHAYLKDKILFLVPALMKFSDLEFILAENKTGWSNTKAKIVEAEQYLFDNLAVSLMPFGFTVAKKNIENLEGCVLQLKNATGKLDQQSKQFWENVWFTSDLATPPEWTGNPQTSWGYDWSTSYDIKAAYEDWDEKIRVLSAHKERFEDIKKSFDLGISPERPLVVFQLEKAKKELNDMISKIKEQLNGIDDTSLQELAETIINQMKAYISNEITNLKNTQQKETGEITFDDGTKIDVNGYNPQRAFNNYTNCCQEDDGDCCGLGLSCADGYALTRTNCDTCVHDTCACYQKATGTCKRHEYTKTECITPNNCQEIVEHYYTCTLNNKEYNSKSKCKNDCEKIEYCYHSNACYPTLTECQSECRKIRCDAYGKPCSQKRCFLTAKNRYEPGYNAYIKLQKEIDELTNLSNEVEKNKTSLQDALNNITNIVVDSLDKLSKALTNLQKKWETTVSFTSFEHQESEMGRAYLNKIIELRKAAEDIMNTQIPNLQSSLKIIEQHIEFIKTLKENLSSLVKKEKVRNMINSVFQNLINTFTSVKGLTNRVIGSAIDKIGPVEIGSNYPCVKNNTQLLYRLKCFEQENGRTFDQLLKFMDVLYQMENGLFVLSQVGEILPTIEPSLDMQPLQIKPNLMDEITEKAYCCKKPKPTDCKATWDDTKCNEHLTLFEGQQPEESSFEKFKKDLLANPLNTLQEKFTALMNYLIGNNPETPSVQYSLQEAKKKMADDAVFGAKTIPSLDLNSLTLTSEPKKGGKGDDYGPLLDQMQKQASELWNDLIWGNSDVSEKIRSACDVLFPVLDSDPLEIENQCKARTTQQSETGEYFNISLLGNKTLKEQCKILDQIDLDILENVQNDSTYIERRLNELQELRNCITREQSCTDANGKHPCIVCPKWFCLNKDGFWGAGAMNADPYCVEQCQNRKEGQNTGYVCDTTNNIIWDTSTHGPIPSANPDQTSVCEPLKLNFAQCAQNNVEQRCSSLNNIDCSIFEQCSGKELERQQGIQKWIEVRDENQCPKWFCLNNKGNWGGKSAVNTDQYCLDHCGANEKPNDGMYCDVNQGIIWDTSRHPNQGSQVWPPPGKSDPNATIRNQCIQAQLKLKDLNALDANNSSLSSSSSVDCSVVQPVINFCSDSNTCNKAKDACFAWEKQKQGRQTALISGKPPMEWPPKSRCTGFINELAKGYLGAQNACISTQKEMLVLKGLRKAIDEAKTALCPDCSDKEVIEKLIAQCNKLDYQIDFAQDCYNFGILKMVKNGEPDWFGQVKTDLEKTDKDVEDDKTNAQNSIKNLCNISIGQGKVMGKEIESLSSPYKELQCPVVGSGGPAVDFTLPLPSDAVGDNNIKEAQEAQEARLLVKKLCTQSSSDMRTPLNEVMKVFSLLLGVKSYSGAKNGISALYYDALRLRKRASDTIALIKGFPAKFKELWGKEDTISKITKASVKIEPLHCVQGPMVSYAGSDKKPVTGPKGGPVCPDVSSLFAQMDTLFAEVRQNLKLIDMTRRVPNTSFSLFNKNLKVEIKDTYQINKELDKVVRPLYDRAESIKSKTQLMWALASAINFANANCTCGKSYCPMIGSVPFCVSGLPLTFTPLKEPFCHLVWSLRFPLATLAEKLKEDLESEYWH